MQQKILGVIPARYGSVRFPAKVLANLHGKPVVQWVYERASLAIPNLVVATDNQLVADAVASFGGNFVMTSAEHISGTDRCCEAMELFDKDVDYVVNIQGDEPFIDMEQLQKIVSLLDGKTEIATLINPVSDWETLENPSEAKVILNVKQEAIYFSRSVIPFVRGLDKSEWLNQVQFYRHLGVYAYRADVLRQIAQLSPSPLEKAESLEQLRWIENGFKIKVGITDFDCIGIDTPDDLEKVIDMLLKGKIFL
jgi:3-deoxy-manno-octulosonate cytidylyltransferase (CMP-KDO synthetase)